MHKYNSLFLEHDNSPQKFAGVGRMTNLVINSCWPEIRMNIDFPVKLANFAESNLTWTQKFADSIEKLHLSKIPILPAVANFHYPKLEFLDYTESAGCNFDFRNFPALRTIICDRPLDNMYLLPHDIDTLTIIAASFDAEMDNFIFDILDDILPNEIYYKNNDESLAIYYNVRVAGHVIKKIKLIN